MLRNAKRTEDRKAEQLLNEHLCGKELSTITLGDWWALLFGDDLWIQAQTVTAVTWPRLPDLLKAEAMNPDELVSGVLVLQQRHRTVREARIGPEARLALRFDSGRELVFTTDNEIVDWQWALNRTGADPYADYIVACFSQGEVETQGERAK